MKADGGKVEDEQVGKEEKKTSFIPHPSSFVSKRVVTGLVLLALVLVVLFVPNPLPLTLLVWLLGMVGLWEYMSLMEPNRTNRGQVLNLGVDEAPEEPMARSGPNSRPDPIRLATSFLTFTLLILGCYLGNMLLVLGSLFLPFACFARDLFMFGRDPGEWPQRRSIMGLFVTGPLYLGLGLGLAVFYKVEGELWPLIFVAACVWAGDTVAYYVGKALGRRPLHPLSPKKTWEGTLAGLVVGALAAMVVALLGKIYPWWLAFLVGLVVNALGQLGDLLESFLKRVAGVKDSGTIFPGHGGVLDRIDSLLLALPAYALLSALISLF